jgi:hypothetical protein
VVADTKKTMQALQACAVGGVSVFDEAALPKLSGPPGEGE